MKILPYIVCLLFLVIGNINGQTSFVDSLIRVLENEKDEDVKLRLFTRIGHYYQDNSDPKAIEYYQEALTLAEKLNNGIRIANSHYNIAYSQLIKGDYDLSIDNYIKSALIYEELQDSFRLSNAWMSIASIYSENKQFEKTDEYHDKAESLILAMKDTFLLCDIYSSRGILSDQMGKLDEAIKYFEKAISLARQIGYEDMLSSLYSNLGISLKQQGKATEALAYFQQTQALFEKWDTPPYYFAALFNNIASANLQLKNYPKAEEYFSKSVDYATRANAPTVLIESYQNLSEMYGEQQNLSQQIFYLNKYHSLKDSIFTTDNKNRIIQLEADYQIEQKNVELAQQEVVLTKQKNQRNFLYAITGFITLLLGGISMFFIKSKRTNTLLEQKNTVINGQNIELETTLKNLKATQSQLIQSEKMASLGELTAGIAHEIQNPLNFVNNFSEINTELTEELLEEVKEGNLKEIEAIAKDIAANEKKIVHHGKRADGIVKGMLLHSRSNSGKKEETNINALAEEYVRLAYHGLRAKYNSFNATIETNYDPNLPKVKAVPQDIGRLLLNIINNAFQAGHERQKSEPNYHASVAIKTEQMNEENIRITISDNGPGIPSDIRDKIFQPFFTTKPTGQGTGLGLSLSYDIVKAHEGEIEVESEEGKGTEIRVILPIV